MVKAWGGWISGKALAKASGRAAAKPRDFLEALWLVVEQGGPRAEAMGIPRLVDNPAAITSFVVGDVVCLGMPNNGPVSYWLVDVMGWMLLGSE